MSDEENKEKEIKINVKPLSNLNSFHDNIFSQIDRRLMEQGRLNVMQSLGTNSIQQMISDYQDIISGNSLSELLTNIRNSIPEVARSFTREFSEYNKMINQNVFSHIGSSYGNIASMPTAALSNLSSMHTQLLSSVPKISESYSNVLSTMMRVQNTLIEKGVLSSLTENLNRVTKSINYKLFIDVSEMIQNNREYLNDAFNQSFKIEGNSLIIEKERYPIEEIKSVVEQVIEESGISKVEQDLMQRLNEINKSIIKSDKNNLKFFVLSLIASIIIQFVFTVYGEEIKEYSSDLFKQKSKTALKKVAEASKQLPFETQIILKSYKIVSVQVLNLRMYAKQKSKKIGELYFGQLVFVKKVQKDWTLIQFVNDDDTEKIEGWVFSRYLKKIK